MGVGVVADVDLEFFADESGNTNANHLDPEQPFYITGGWLIRAPDGDPTRARVRQAREALGATELSGPRLVRSGKGRRIVLNLLAEMMRHCTPVVVIIEKKFALAIRISGELLRLPVATPGARSPTAREEAREIAAALCGLPQAVLEAANEFAKSPNTTNARQCLSLLAASLPEVRLERLVSVAEERLQSDTAKWGTDSILARSFSPNALAFTTLAQKLELLARRCGRTIRFVHDELPFLKDIYEHFQDFARGLTSLGSHSEFFARAGCPGAITHVSMPEFRDSSREPLIEAADVLVGSIAAFLRRVEAGGRWTEHEAPLAAFLLGGFIEPELRSVFHFVGSDETARRVGEAVVSAVNIVSKRGDGS